MTMNSDWNWDDYEEVGGGQAYLTEGDHEAVIHGAEVVENQYGPSLHYHIQFPKYGEKVWQKFTPLSGRDKESTNKARGRAKSELKKLGLSYKNIGETYDNLANDAVGLKVLVNCKSRGEGKPGFWFNFVKVTGRDRDVTQAQQVFGEEPAETLLID